MVIDTTRPSIGRIYDFMLGGHHNYEVDREASAGLLKVFPTYPKWARINRWFLQYVAAQWAEQGERQILDIASGLPTQGHFNDALPAARILFTDNDPLSVAYGQDLLKDSPNMAYCEGDARAPGAIVEAASRFFGDDRRVAIGAIGIAYFVPDEPLTALMQHLHAWAAPGSVMAVSYIARLDGPPGESFDVINDTMQRLAGMRVSPRTAEALAERCAPWKLVKSDTLERMLDVPEMFADGDRLLDGGYMGGAFFER